MRGKVLFNKRLGGNYYYMKIESSDFLKSVEAGNFLMLKVNPFENSVDPLLRRPFGVCDIDNKGFTILYAVVGKGTKILSTINEKSYIEFSEPLGNGFKIVEDRKVALVAGGVGIAPLLLLSRKLKEKNNKVYLFYGGKTENDIHLLNEFDKYCDKISIATENGQLGEKGFVTDFIKEDFDFFYACGPKPMMEKCVEIAKEQNSEIEVSLDERMACGMGACLGCIIYIKENGEILQKRCCVEGPIFDGKKVAWELL